MGNLDNYDPAVTDALATGREMVLTDNAGVGLSTGAAPERLALVAILTFLELNRPLVEASDPALAAWIVPRNLDYAHVVHRLDCHVLHGRHATEPVGELSRRGTDRAARVRHPRCPLLLRRPDEHPGGT
jgi:hypothetical protein